MDRKQREKINYELVSGIVGLLLIVGLLSYLVWKSAYYTVNGDDAAELILAKLLASEGGIISSNWYYSTELRVLNTQLFRIPLFWITNNWTAVRVISNLGLYTTLLASYYFFLRQFEVEKKWFLWTGGFLLWPISYEYYYVISFAGYYVPFLIYSFLIMGCYGAVIKKGLDKKVIGILMITSFLSGLGGIRQFMITFAPMILAIVWRYWKRGEYKGIVAVFTSTFAAGIGYIVNQKLLSRIYDFASMEVMELDSFSLDKFIYVVNNILFAFGYDYDANEAVELLSIKGIDYVLGIGLLVLVVILGISIAHYYEGFKKEEQLLFSFILFLIPIHLFLDLFVVDGIKPRYYVLLMVWLIPTIVLYVRANHIPIRNRRMLIGGILVCLVLTGAMEYKEQLGRRGNVMKEGAIAFIEKEGYTFGYGDFWDAAVIEEMTEGKLQVVNLLPNMGYPILYPWLEEKAVLKENAHMAPVFYIHKTGDTEYENFGAGKEASYRDDYYTVHVYGSSQEFIMELKEYEENYESTGEELGLPSSFNIGDRL